MTDEVLIEKSGGVLTVTINRPEKKNALTYEMYEAIGGAIDSAGDDAEVRCVLIQANGDLFCAGNDMADFEAAHAGDPNAGPIRNGRNPLLDALARATTPLVAAVQGRAVGVGTTMLLHCDLVLVTEDTKLTVPFVGLGLPPEAASSLLLTARVGHARAFSMFVLGEAATGAQAVEWGIANELVAVAELRSRARVVAEAVAARPAGVVVTTKRLMREAAAIRARMDEEGALFAGQMRTPEVGEALAAFREKRAPVFNKAQ